MDRLKLGVVMDPIQAITPYKDTTLALLLEAQRRGWVVHYLEMADLYIRDGQARGRSRRVEVRDDNDDWYTLEPGPDLALAELDTILMRKDPPFDTEYIYATYILERAETAGTLLVNRPSALRDVNEKMAITAYADLCPPTLVGRDARQFREFLAEQGEIVVKPLDGMGGSRVFHIKRGDTNLSVILEVLTEHGSRFAMAQRYLPQILDGDKRILMIDAEPVPYALARIPAQGELRGNLAAGGRGQGVELSAADRRICAAVAPMLRARGLLFVGLDVIGDKLTEINVTSPTCVRELEKIYGLNIAGQLLDAVAARVKADGPVDASRRGGR
ncbi:MAG: glutathione synthase [Salinisphaera sp.]|nr:glutathione synthase [Salinisphaera sp.]